MSQVCVLPVEGEADLYHRYPGADREQPVVVGLDLARGELRAEYRPVADAVPLREHHGIERTIPIPPLTASAANALLRALAPLAQRVVAGADVSSQAVRLDAAASAAWDEMVELVGRMVEDAPVVSGISVRELWPRPDDLIDLGLAATSTDDDLRSIAAELARALAGPTVVVVVDDAAIHVLAEYRDALRSRTT